MKSVVKHLAQSVVNRTIAVIPRPTPNATTAAGTRIVAHRGNTGMNFRENTLEAFDACWQQRIWGVELDIQWSRDGVAMVIHDSDTRRVFGAPGLAIDELSFEDIRRQQPSVPRLEEVIDRYGGRMHLMIELKRETHNHRHLDTLKHLLQSLRPIEDYHLLALDFGLIESLPDPLNSAVMMVAETNTRHIVEGVLSRKLAACSGHYLLFNSQVRRLLGERHCRYGVGFIDSRNGLYREIHLGSHWVFTNHGHLLQGWLNHCLMGKD